MFTINNFNSYHTFLPLLQKITLSNSYLSYSFAYFLNDCDACKHSSERTF